MTTQQAAKAYAEREWPYAANEDREHRVARNCGMKGFEAGSDWREQSQWIPVTERLPEFTDEIAGNKVSDFVLIVVEGEIHTAYLEAVRPDFTKLIWTSSFDEGHDFKFHVTHWQPLPLPPKTTT